MLNWLATLFRGETPRAGSGTLVSEALALAQSGRHEDALQLLYRALALAPGAAEIHLHLADVHRALGRDEAVLDSCLEAVRLAPGLAQARNNLGNAYRKLGRADEAIAEYRQAVALEPGLPEAHFNWGLTLQLRGAADEAMLRYREALQHKPDLSFANLNLGLLLEERGDASGAIACYGAAVAAEPALVEAHVNLGMQLLLCGRLAEGWEEYEWRLRYPEYGGADVAALAPRWDGAALAGRVILLDAEQGFGDAIQFLRYAPLVAQRGGRVLVRCARELTELAASAPGVEAAIARGGPLPQFDFSCPLPGLPRIFGTTLESIPAPVPYLSADPSREARWRSRLGNTGRTRVGLVWASQSGHRTATAKSLALRQLAPLADVPGLALYSLQKGEAARQASEAPALEDLSRELDDFSDTAAAIANLDLVISVDTAVAHLAGAMGKPTWTLLKYAPDWRWLLGREDCPWYPTMTLFRQQAPGDWRAPLEALVTAARGWAAQGRPAGR